MLTKLLFNIWYIQSEKGKCVQKTENRGKLQASFFGTTRKKTLNHSLLNVTQRICKMKQLIAHY